MRVIAGIARGMPLVVPRDGTRPTADRIREAIFSSLGERVAGATVLDLYAGTGALGLEAASRGATAVAFVEKARPALVSLERNLTAFRRGREVSCELAVVRADVFAYLDSQAKTGRQFSLLFADPPYGDAAQRLVEDARLPGLIAPAGLLVLESAKRDALVPGAGWITTRDAVYGDTRVTFLGRQ